MNTIRKALTATAFGIAGALGTALTDGAVTWPEALACLGTGLLAGTATYSVTNAVTEA